VDEISVILRDPLITREEFVFLDQFSYSGKIWMLIHKPEPAYPVLIKQRALEYIFEAEALLMFAILSKNILAKWDTSLTKNLSRFEEYNIKDSFYIRPYI